MIKLTKSPEPGVLTTNGTQWTDDYLRGLENGNLTDAQKFRYRHPEIKQAIRVETFEKCAYCESKVSHVHPGETDHILPVSRRPDLVVSWDNLTYVCTECNRRKSDYYSEAEPLVNPYVDQPNDHLIFYGPMVLHKDDKGLRTSRKIELSRVELFERKQEKIETLNFLIQKWRECPEGETRTFLQTEILEYAKTASEFSATLKAFIYSELGWDM
ncbi:MAG: HNH endonuclease signature motif containing protein [Gammaproteobacteria bacterium]|nr:HNH endonuclease signature motif containing protein [Gammaproteobacteria bacterium]